MIKKSRILSETNVSRRSFCRGLAIGMGGLVVVSCGRFDKMARQPVLKYPENADEIADVWHIFADREFNADKAVSGLGITGEPVVTSVPAGQQSAYPAQNDRVQAVELITRPNQLTEIRIAYSRPVRVSFDDLIANFPIAPLPPGAVGSISVPTHAAAFAANVGPRVMPSGTPSNGRQSFEFRASHVVETGPTTNGTILLTVPADGASQTGIHEVWRVGFLKFA